MREKYLLEKVKTEDEMEENKEVVFNKEQIDVLRKRTRELVGEIIKNEYSVLVFMDRSARPISWMIRAAWDKYADGKPIPAIRFVNIGREKGDVVGWSSSPDYYVDSEDSNGIIPGEKKREIEKKFWSRLEGEDYLKSFKKGLEQEISGGKILLVDDYISSGYSIGLAKNYFRYHFPEVDVYGYSFLKNKDEIVFSKKDWRGTHLPWNTDKAYTLLSEEDDASNVTAKVEKDIEKRNKGIKLKKQIESIFR